MSLTITEIKKKKIELESAILKLAQAFEEETGSFVSYMNFERAVSKEAKEHPVYDMPVCERKGPLENVDIDMRFDL